MGRWWRDAGGGPEERAMDSHRARVGCQRGLGLSLGKRRERECTGTAAARAEARSRPRRVRLRVSLCSPLAAPRTHTAHQRSRQRGAPSQGRARLPARGRVHAARIPDPEPPSPGPGAPDRGTRVPPILDPVLGPDSLPLTRTPVPTTHLPPVSSAEPRVGPRGSRVDSKYRAKVQPAKITSRPSRGRISAPAAGPA